MPFMFQSTLNRRQAMQALALAGASLAFPARAEKPSRKMTINLMCGMIGVQANQRQAIELAHRHGFESVEAMSGDLARLSEAEAQELVESMREQHVVFGAAGLSVDFRGEESKFTEGMRSLSKVADGLQRAGVTRVGTWIMPGHNSLTYLQNFRQHAGRLREVAKVLRDHNLRLGLEYVGTKTLRDRFKYHFIYTMPETKELIAEIGTGNVGFVIDSWHWWNVGETADEILTLQGDQVIAVDLNDAPAGIPKDQQQDGHRELPLATGIIPVGSLLNALNKIGYDGPVRAEPFSRSLNELDNDAACAKTSDALHRAFALIEG